MGDANNRFKILLIGDQSVGKTCMFQQFSDNTYDENQISTIGVEFKHLKIKINENKEIDFTLWDTAGQERFRSITKNYYKGAHGFLLIYDVTNRETLEGIQNWLKSIKENSRPNVKIMLIGNKIDISKKRQISTEEGKQLAKKYSCTFYETSAKSNLNVGEVISTIIKMVYEQELILKEQEDLEKKKLENIPKKAAAQKKSCCSF